MDTAFFADVAACHAPVPQKSPIMRHFHIPLYIAAFLLRLSNIDYAIAQSVTANKNPIQAAKLSVQVTAIPYDTSIKLKRYARSFHVPAGDVFVENRLKISRTPSGNLVAVSDSFVTFPSAMVQRGELNSLIYTEHLFLALGYRIKSDSLLRFSNEIWRSSDDLKTVSTLTSVVLLPGAGKVDYGTNGEWAGLFCHRGILQLRDGTLLAAVYGNFETDTIIPSNPQSKLETKFMLRAFVIKSSDLGNTWEYMSSLAVPKPGQRDDSEGFNEWSMVELADGRIMAIVRTGHFTPPIICYSGNAGASWTEPVVNPELGPASCDPWLLKLSDGRIAISYGEMQQPEGDRKAFFENFKAGDHPRKCRMAISGTPAADHWQTFDITGFGNRSAYSTLYEMAPGTLLYQAGPELYQINLSR
jgi:hypothetical protein